MVVDELSVVCADGQQLAARCYRPCTEAGHLSRRAVLIVPAMATAQSFYQDFAVWLAEQGLMVFTFDYRGIAASAPPSLKGFEASIDDWAHLDVPAMIAVMHERAPDRPWTWLGHSLGGQIFGMVPGAERFERLVAVACGNGYWKNNVGRTRYLALLLWYVLAPLGIALAGYFPGKRLGAVGDLPAAALWQWRKWCLHPDYLGAEGQALRQRYAAVRTPITAVIAQDDELISPLGMRRLYLLYQAVAVQFQTLVPHTLGLQRIGHFGVFRQSASSTLWPLVLNWIARQSPP